MEFRFFWGTGCARHGEICSCPTGAVGKLERQGVCHEGQPARAATVLSCLVLLWMVVESSLWSVLRRCRFHVPSRKECIYQIVMRE